MPSPTRGNIRVYYLLSIASNAYFILGNWIFFWERFMTYGQLGVVDALSFAFGMVMEVPTGVVSDLIGKKRTLIAACLCNTIGYTIMASTNSLSQLVIGFLFFQVGLAFYSGAIEAMAFDTLKQYGEEARFDEVVSKGNAYAIISLVVATLIGGLLYNVNFRLPHYGQSVAFGVGLVGALFLKEPEIDTFTFTIRNYIKQLGAGFQQLWQPALRYRLPVLLGLPGVFYLFAFGLIQPAIAIHFGFGADAQAIIQAALGAVSAIALTQIPWLRRRVGDQRGLLLSGLLLGLGFFGAATLTLGVYGILVLALIRLSGTLLVPWVSIVVNEHVESQYRATTLSTVALVAKIPYIAAAIAAGRMVEAGTFWLFNAFVGGGVMILLISTMVLTRYYERRVRATSESSSTSI